MLGFGVRCEYGTPGTDGNVMFDNVRLYAKTCNPTYAHTTGGLTADFDNDCDVDINDLDRFANLLAGAVLNYAPSHHGQHLRHRYFGTHSTIPALLLTLSIRQATAIQALSKDGLRTTGIQLAAALAAACLYIPALKPAADQSFVQADPNSLDFMTNEAHSWANGGGGVTFSMWANASLIGDFLVQWPGIFGTWRASGDETLEMPCPSRIGPGGSGDTGQVGL